MQGFGDPFSHFPRDPGVVLENKFHGRLCPREEVSGNGDFFSGIILCAPEEELLGPLWFRGVSGLQVAGILPTLCCSVFGIERAIP